MNTTINLSLPQTLIDLAKTRVQAGHYSSLSEVIRTALRQHLLTPELPTYQMSPKTEQTALQALEDYHQGKTKKLHHPTDLGQL